MSYKRNDEDPLMRLIAVLAAMRQIGGQAESQIHTGEQVTPEVRAGMPLLQGLNLFASFVLFAVGLYLTAGGVGWLLDLGWDAGTWLVVLLLAAAAVTGIAWAVNVRAQDASLATRVVVTAAVSVVAAFLFFFVVLALNGPLEFWQTFGMVVGAGLSLAALAVGYNQAMDLINPYWRRSPFESAIQNQLFPALGELLKGGQGQEPEDVHVEDPRWVYRRNGKPAERPYPARPGWTEAQVDGDERLEEEDRERWEQELGEKSGELVTIDPKAGNLVWFGLFAARRPSLSLADLTLHPAPILPFDEDGRQLRLRRAMIRRLIARGSTSEQVIVDGVQERGLGREKGWWILQGQGKDPVWAKERMAVMDEAEWMWAAVMPGPPPDYFADYDAEDRRAA